MKLRICLAIFALPAAALPGQINGAPAGSRYPDPALYSAREGAVDKSVDPNLRLAAAFCQLSAIETIQSDPPKLCWKRVKEALVKARAVPSYPSTPYASLAGDELVSRYGFRKINVVNPYDAPVGAILVYKDNGEAGGKGHVEFRTLHGFVSDYMSRGCCKFRLTGVYIK